MLFGHADPVSQKSAGRRSYTEVVGESFYQPALKRLLKNEGREFTATVRPEPENPHDVNAVAVLAPSGDKLGHLSRGFAKTFQQKLLADRGTLTCAAKLIGGEPGKPTIGVLLDSAPLRKLIIRQAKRV